MDILQLSSFPPRQGANYRWLMLFFTFSHLCLILVSIMILRFFDKVYHSIVCHWAVSQTLFWFQILVSDFYLVFLPDNWLHFVRLQKNFQFSPAASPYPMGFTQNQQSRFFTESLVCSVGRAFFCDTFLENHCKLVNSIKLGHANFNAKVKGSRKNTRIFYGP